MKIRRYSKYKRIIRMLQAGASTMEICEKLNTSPQYIYTVKSSNRKMLKDESAEVFESAAPQELNFDEIQIGGDHYKKNKIQVWDAIHEWRLGYFSGNVIKYVARHKEKNGIEDLKKARHYLDKYIKIIEAKDGK